MKNTKYIELSEPQLSAIENHFDYIPDEKEIDNISFSLDKHALKRTLRLSKTRFFKIKNISEI